MIRLNWTRNDIHNAIISSEDNEIMYEVSTPSRSSSNNRVTTLTKLDKDSGKKIVTGEIAWKAMRSQAEVRFGSEDGEWILANEWLKNSKGLSTAKTFTAAEGVQYRWKLRNFKEHLTSAEDPPEGRSPSLAIFHSHVLKGPNGPADLEISPSVIPSLDYILVALLLFKLASI
ncbi:hypothetical protein M407DRAFT_241903 [Tulasnella calospora MUT 4182]|uniref:DUF6593 domain-containing protein n=1 Tax=Tulasnella calospora MUT 4182 TaxID=1051891 RepID=A0A0C3QT01_9AGAM|nr:hypothetical protein M407DRAFT_241903 [Tulasnella calospora MUT 4182]